MAENQNQNPPAQQVQQPAKPEEKKQPEKTVTKYLRVNPKHPSRKYNLGKHKVGAFYQAFELNEAEQKELKGAGPKQWIQVGDEKKAAAEADLKKRIKSNSMGYRDDL